MKTPYKQLMLLVFLYFTTVFFAGCMDTSVNPIPGSINYSSQMKVVNLVTGASSANITLDGQALGSVSFGGEIPGSGSGFLTIPSGSRNLVAVFDNGQPKNLRFSATTEYKFRTFLIGTANAPSLVVVNQRYIWQTKDSQHGQKLFPADTAWISIFNGSPDVSIKSISVGNKLTEFGTPLEIGKGSAYLKNAAGTFTVTITYNNTQTLSFDYSFNAKNRYTVALYDAAAQLKHTVLVDD